MSQFKIRWLPVVVGFCLSLISCGTYATAEDAWSLAADPAVSEPIPAPQASLRIPFGSQARLLIAPRHPSDFVLTIPQNGESTVWSLSTGKSMGKINSKVDSSKSEWVALSVNGTRALVVPNGFGSAAVDVWDTTRSKLLHRLEPGAAIRRLEFVDFVGVDRAVTYPGKDGHHSVTLWDLTMGDAIRTLLTPAKLTPEVVATSPGGKYLAVSVEHKNLILLYDLTTGQLVHQLTFNGAAGFWDTCQGLAFSPDGSELAALFVAKPAQLRVWNLPKGEMTINASISADPHGNLHGRPSYNGREFDWIPDGSGWLCYGYFWIDRANLRTVRDLRMKAPFVVSGIRPVGPDLVAYCSPERMGMLFTERMPPLNAAGDDLHPLLKQGDRVAIDIELGAVRTMNTEALEKALRAALEVRLRQLDFQVADTAPIVLKLSYREEAGKLLPKPKQQNTPFLPPPRLFGVPRANPDAPGQGTGFVISPQGHVVTCAHVVGKAEGMTVKLGKRKHKAVVLERNERTDLALLKFPGEKEQFLRLRDSDKFELGEDVRAVGFPMTDVLGESLKLTKGSLSGVIQRDKNNVFMIDASLNPGNSGGPLIDQQGLVLGINSAKFVGLEVDRVGMSVPTNRLKEIYASQKLEWSTEATNGDAGLKGPELLQRLEATVAMILPPGAEDQPESQDEATSTVISSNLSWRATGREEPIWSTGIGEKSSVTIVQGGWNDDNLRLAAFRQFEQQLKTAGIPYYISSDAQRLLPQVVELPTTVAK